MKQSFFFYDLETSGFDARYDRIMQFAGQRTDMDFKPIGEPYNFLIKLTDDVLPSPDALLVTGITPQQTLDEGLTEAQAAKLLIEEVFTPGTITVGFNNIRFDDEFIRNLFWRNFIDPYEWAWKENRSRWDMLDIVRITRALRPDGIVWPYDADKKPTNRLELLTKENNLAHIKAHDALSDVQALIAVAKLIHQKQPKLFDYMLKMRSKNEVSNLVNLDSKQPFVYVSGSLSSEYNKATIAFPLTSGPNSSVVIYDLRHDPSSLVGLSSSEIGRRLFNFDQTDDDYAPLPVKLLHLNKSPAVAPLSVLATDKDWQNIGLNKDDITKHLNILLKNHVFAENIRTLYESRPPAKKSNDPEAQLYDGFAPEADKIRIDRIKTMSESDLADFHPNFIDERLSELFLHYKARSFPNSLAEDEVRLWEKWRQKRIKTQLPNFSEALNRLAKSDKAKSNKYLLEEIKLYAESIMPEYDEA